MTSTQKTEREILLGKKAEFGPLRICPVCKLLSSLSEGPDTTMGYEMRGGRVSKEATWPQVSEDRRLAL